VRLVRRGSSFNVIVLSHSIFIIYFSFFLVGVQLVLFFPPGCCGLDLVSEPQWRV